MLYTDTQTCVKKSADINFLMITSSEIKALLSTPTKKVKDFYNKIQLRGNGKELINKLYLM